MRTLNLGILAHVDAGKTTLTERLLHAAGVIDKIGSVDDGNTQTDTLTLERQRGITIKSAVVSFVVDDVAVNLIDTPGHPDFIAEVERVLNVLDGAVLVVSAVEGVQPQTRVLMRTLQRLRIPTLIFVNKIDRGGAQHESLLQSIAERLTPSLVPMGSTSGLGTRDPSFRPYAAADAAFVSGLVDLLADNDEAFLAAYVDDEQDVSYDRLRGELAAQTGKALVHPVFFGSAITGAGLEPLISGIAELLPAAEGDADGPVSGAVFKVERGRVGEKVAFLRMFSGTVRARDRLQLGRDEDEKVTRVCVFDRGEAVERASVAAGSIGKLWGLDDVRTGDTVGESRTTPQRHHFAPPMLETVVVPRHPSDKGALHVALVQLAEQDPLINVRQDDVRQEMYVSLYGEVQKEVIGATLANEYDLDVEFRETTTICVERPIGGGAALELIDAEANPFLATVGLRVEPAPVDTGVRVQDGGQGRDDAALRVQGGRGVPEGDRGHGAGDAAPGPLRVAGHRLQGHDDAVRLLFAGELREGLQAADAAGPDGGAGAGRNRGVRADASLPARDPAGHARGHGVRAGAARAPFRRRRRCGDRRTCWRARYRRPGSTSCSNNCRRLPTAKACSRPTSPWAATGPSMARPLPARGRTTTRSTVKST